MIISRILEKRLGFLLLDVNVIDTILFNVFNENVLADTIFCFSNGKD